MAFVPEGQAVLRSASDFIVSFPGHSSFYLARSSDWWSFHETKLFNYLITLIIVGLAVWAAVSLYRRYVEQPWTRDGPVRANIVGIALRVSGPIIRVAVRDNQQLRQGDLLFEIDPADFQTIIEALTRRKRANVTDWT
jgi:multidrug resistance efflux pump